MDLSDLVHSEASSMHWILLKCIKVKGAEYIYILCFSDYCDIGKPSVLRPSLTNKFSTIILHCIAQILREGFLKH